MAIPDLQDQGGGLNRIKRCKCMTYRKKAATAATPANARLPLTVEAAPVNLGELTEVVFFTGLPVPVGINDVRLARVVGQALTVMVTTDAEEWTAAGLEVAETGMVELE